MTRKKAEITSKIKFGQQAQAQFKNPTLTSLEFVFTDNLPNANNQAVGARTFAKLIETGQYMPVKMVEGMVEGHFASVPIGVIQEFKKVEADGVESLIGKAALWSEEFNEEIKLIKEAHASDSDSINISWELLYTKSEIDEDDIEWLLDPIVRAATVVGEFPAYQGRTPLLSIAQKGNTETNMNLEKALNRILELELLISKHDEAMTKLTSQLSEKGDALVESQNAVAENKSGLKELDELRQFKADAEAQVAAGELLDARLTLFVEAGVEFSPEEIEERKASWLSMEDEQFDFLVKELGAVKKSAEANVQDPDDEVIPGPVSKAKKKDTKKLILDGWRKHLDKKDAA